LGENTYVGKDSKPLGKTCKKKGDSTVYGAKGKRRRLKKKETVHKRGGGGSKEKNLPGASGALKKKGVFNATEGVIFGQGLSSFAGKDGGKKDWGVGDVRKGGYRQKKKKPRLPGAASEKVG